MLPRDRGQEIFYSTHNGQLERGKNYPSTEDIYGHDGNGSGELLVTAFPVNMLGIHQLGGNGAEWMKDWYSIAYYSDAPIHNPQGPAQSDPQVTKDWDGIMKSIRGFDMRNYNNDSAKFQDMTNYARSRMAPIPTLVNGKNDENPENDYGGGISFRCVINTDTSLDKLKLEAAAHQQNPSLHSTVQP